MSSSFRLFVALLPAVQIGHSQTLNVDKLRSYEQVLSDVSGAYSSIANADGNSVLATCASRYPCAFNAAASNNPPQSFNFTIIDDELPTAFTQIMLPNHDTANTTNVLAGCRIAQMQSTWKKYLDNTITTIPRGELFYQYYATSNNVFGTYPQLSWQCSTPYIPTLRPYYVSATTGPKDLVIVIDVSVAQTRLADAKAAANALLDTLSFYDYVAVVAIGTSADTSITPVPQRATVARVAELKSKVNALATVTDALSSDPVEGMKAAVQLLITGEHAVSGCTQTVMLITSGLQEYSSTVSLEDYLRPFTRLIFFALITEVSGTTESGLKHVLRAACQQHGLVSKSQSASDILQSLEFYPAYFASMRTASETRVSWSEVYEDAFGQGMILSASRPEYETASNAGSLTGMFVLDAPMSAVAFANGSLTQAQQIENINTELLSLSQVCDVLDETVFAAKSTNLVALQDKTGYECANLMASGGDDNPKKLLPLWVIIGIVIAFLLWVPCLCVLCKCSPNPDACTIVGFTWVAVLTATYWIVSMSLFFAISYGQFIDQKPRQAVKYTAERLTTNPYRCCDVLCDGCSTAPSNVEACSFLSTTLLLEAECDNGYHCCRESCRNNNANEGGRNCRCVDSVSRRLCRTQCGTCHRPTLFASYDYTDNNGVTQRHTALFSETCGRNDQNCLNSFEARYPIGEVKDGWVNPSDLSVLYTENPVKQGPIIAWSILAALAVVGSIMLLVIVCMDVRSQRKSYSRSAKVDSTPNANPIPPTNENPYANSDL